MAVIGDAQLLSDIPEGNLHWRGQKFWLKYAVYSDDLDDGIFVIRNAPLLPQRGEPFAFNLEANDWAICRELEFKRIGPRHPVWSVTCHFETIEKTDNAQTLAAEIATFSDIFAETPEVKMTYEIFQQPVWATIDPNTNDEFGPASKPIVNSAGELISPPFMRDYARKILTISRNEPADNELQILVDADKYANSLNSDNWWGVAPHMAKMMPFGIERRSCSQGETGELVVYFRVTYTIHFNYPDWDARPLDNGANYINAAGVPTAYTSAKGHQMRGLLDGNGKPLGGLIVGPPGTPGLGNCAAVPAGTPPVFLGPYQIYPEQPFAALSLPQSLMGV